MKISEVPQDDVKTMQGEKKALYAVDERGDIPRPPPGAGRWRRSSFTQVIDDFEEKAGRPPPG